jgi:hypothetical protein
MKLYGVGIDSETKIKLSDENDAIDKRCSSSSKVM